MVRQISILLALAQLASAAAINWLTPQNITGTLADFDTIGTPVYQWNGGTNSVTIDPGGMNIVFSPGALFGSSVYTNVDPHNRGQDASYETLLSTMTHTNSTASLNLTGLTVGHQYRVQLWMADTRSCCQGRKKTYDSGSGSSQVVLDSGPPSQFVIGVFVADATTQTIRFVGSGAQHPQYNALAVRTLGAPTPVVDLWTAEDSAISSDVGINVAPSTSVTLRWDVDNADLVSIDHGVGAVSNSGSTVVAPTSTTTYTLTTSNTHGTTQESLTVYVNASITAPWINEIVSNNDDGLADEDGEPSDWIELYNSNSFAINAGNYRLTDDSTLASTWQFPNGATLPAGGYLVVFASGKNRLGNELHTDFKLDSNGEYLALTDAAGITVLSQLPVNFPTTANFPEIPKDRSYGYDDTAQLRFFATPSPGEENADGFLGFTQDTTFSHDRGFYESSFNLTILSETSGASIRYTTDGSPPSETVGTVYSGPISISQTTVIRAIAYKTGYTSTNVDTHSYIFASDVIASNVMDTSITQNGTYAPQMIDSLKALPVLSINIEDPNGVSNDVEKATSVELIFPDGSNGFQEDAGVSYFGGYFTNFAKKSFRLYFRKQYGVGKLNFPLFEGHEHGIAPVKKFDALDLRSGSHDMAMRGAYLSNRFTDDSLLEMGNISPHGRFVHLFRNGVYWGQYHLRERWNASMGAEYFGGDKDDYEAINGNLNVGGWAPGVAYDGSGQGWQTIKDLANGSTPWSSLQSRLDMQSYLDFWLLYDFGSSENEYRAFGQPIDNGVKMKFHLNDADGWLNPTGIAQNNDAGGPGNILGRLESENHPDFKTYFADRIYAAYFHNGAFAAANTVARLQNRFDETILSFLCESARWGYRTPSSFNNYQNNLINNQLPAQTASRLNDLRNSGRYPNVDAPEYNQNGGVVAPNFGLFFQSPSGGTVYYTTDGSDPRLPGGAINPTATPLTVAGGNITLINQGTNWKYRDNGSNLGTTWKEVSYNDAAWASGNAKFGYGDNNETTTISYGGNSSNKYITTYFRKTFNVADASALTGLTLELLRDDGAVVYINNSEVLRSNMPAGNIAYNTASSTAVSSNSENAFTQFNLPASSLSTGTNLIAVEIHQHSPSSSDIGFNLRLHAATGNSSPNLVLSQNTLLKARVKSGNTWSAIHPAQFIVSQPPSVPQLGDLVISELHYHPSDPSSAESAALPGVDEDDFEFIELMNISAQPLRLDDCVFTDGIAYVFPEESILQPGERLVIVKNSAAFALRHASSMANGSFSGSLKNSGETIALENPSSTEILSLTYSDGTDRGQPGDTLWSSKPDGSGESLVLIHPASGLDPSNPLLWRASTSNDGSPASTDSSTLPLPNSDDDSDGSVALLERTLNSSDEDGTAQPQILAQRETIDGTEYLTLTFVRDSLIESHLTVQTSTALSGWLDDAVLLDRQQHNDGTETLKYRFPAPSTTGADKQFMRVKVSQ